MRSARHNVFAPQKGADAACVQRLDEGLRHFAAVLRQRLGIPVDKLPGGGAAGGFGAGCAALLGGTLRSGIKTVLDTVDFDRRAAGYDLIVTGEGRLDSQSLGGKAVSGVAGRCRAAGIPAAALVGALALEPDDLAALGLCSARSINPAGVTLQDAKAHAAAYYRDALVKTAGGGELMPHVIEITDFLTPELDVYARATENQLVNRADPSNALFIAEESAGDRAGAGCRVCARFVPDGAAAHHRQGRGDTDAL